MKIPSANVEGRRKATCFWPGEDGLAAAVIRQAHVDLLSLDRSMRMNAQAFFLDRSEGVGSLRFWLAALGVEGHRAREIAARLADRARSRTARAESRDRFFATKVGASA